MFKTLNWQNDPMLIDPIPTSKNQWLTANKLIERQVQDTIFLQPNILNLFAIMLRKIDFQSGERLLQSFPYVTLSDSLANKMRKATLLLAERCHYYFQKTAIDYSIKKWQTKLINYLDNQKRLPFPLFRLSDQWQDFLIQEFAPFQSARGEHFHLPTRLTNDLAYFLGVVIGDGHLNFHNIELVDFSKEHMLMLQAIAKKLFGIEGTISGEKKTWLLHLNNKWLVRLTNFLTDQPITGKKYPALREPLIFQSDDSLRWQFWSGVLDADGSYKRSVSFSTSSKFFALEFIHVLTDFGISQAFSERQTDFGVGFTVYIKAKSKAILSRLLLPRHPIKKREFETYLSLQRYNLTSSSTDHQYIDYKHGAILTFNGTQYFDFSQLPSLHVIKCAKFLQSARKLWSLTQKEMADFLGISKGLLASYEYRDSLPLSLLENLLPKLPAAPNHLMVFLDTNNLMYFRSRRSHARLSLQPSNKLLSLIKNLSQRNRYLLIHSSRDEASNIPDTLCEYFDVKTSNINQIHNTVLQLYLKTFFQTKSDED